MPRAVAVAYSGGRDSTALLHATLVAAAAQDVEVHALHVHHGLSAHADDWLAHGERQCARWARRGLPVHFHAERLALKPARGESVEALARTTRYAALRRMALAAGCELVLLAHHRRDQAETLLLQALRGAGVAGLAGMPAEARRDGITWARPWLGLPPGAIAAYVKQHRLSHIEDDSNIDRRYARNRLRLEVWPSLAAAFPQAEAVLADAATWAADADAALRELAALDLAACRDGRALDLAAWQALSAPRAGNALRVWLREATGRSPSAAEVQRLLRELPAGRGPARWPLAAGELRRYRGRLRFELEAATEAAAPRETALAMHRAGRYRLPGWGGVLVARRVRNGGVALARLAALQLAERGGGERFRLADDRPARSLKKQFQAAGLPAWQRDGPLLYGADGMLLFVPGLGIDAAARAAVGEPQLALAWEPDASRRC